VQGRLLSGHLEPGRLLWEHPAQGHLLLEHREQEHLSLARQVLVDLFSGHRERALRDLRVFLRVYLQAVQALRVREWRESGLVGRGDRGLRG
jgi:hypothetical protein